MSAGEREALALLDVLDAQAVTSVTEWWGRVKSARDDLRRALSQRPAPAAPDAGEVRGALGLLEEEIAAVEGLDGVNIELTPAHAKSIAADLRALLALLDGEWVEDGSGRSPEGQALLDHAQEIRAIKRPQDPEWPILTFVEAMHAAASMLDSESPTTAANLRKGTNYLLNVAARAEAFALEETKRRVVVEFRETLPARSAARLRGEFQIAVRGGTPSRGPYLTTADYETVDAALSLLEHLDQDARPLPSEAVEQEIHGLCPGHPIAKDRAATCAVCNMSRVTLDRLTFLDVTGRVEWAEACGMRLRARSSTPDAGEVQKALRRLDEEIALTDGLTVAVELTREEALALRAALRARSEEAGWQGWVNSTRPGIGIADACEVVTLVVPRPCGLKSGDEVAVRLVQERSEPPAEEASE